MFSSAQGQPCSPDTPITQQYQLDALSGCKTISKDVKIQSMTINATVPPPAAATILLSSLEVVEGSLEISDVQVAGPGYSSVQIDLPPLSIDLQIGSLRSVKGNLVLRNLTLATLPSLGFLTEVGSMSFDQVAFQDGNARYINRSLQDVTFQGCAGLQAFRPSSAENGTGQEMEARASETEASASVHLVDNQDLVDVSLRGYSDLKTSVEIYGNGPNLTVDLGISSGSLNISGVTRLDADQLQILAPSESTASQVIRNNNFTSLGFPRLARVEGTMEIYNNPSLITLMMPVLERVGTLDIAGPLQSIEFPNNSEVHVTGEVKISPKQASACSSLPNNFHCSVGSLQSGALNSLAQASATATSRGSSSPIPTNGIGSSRGGGGLSQGAKIGIGVGVGLGGLLVLLGGLYFFFRSRKRNTRSPRSAGAGDYPMSEQKAVEHSPVRYSKVPAAATDSFDEPTPQSQRPVSTPLADDWTPPGQAVPSTDGRVELEEQQGPRHEMDAQSLPPDMDEDDDNEDARSLQDIERIHEQSR